MCDDSVTWQWGFKDGYMWWVLKCHQNLTSGCREVVPLCDPGVQSHALDVSSFLLWFVRRPEELGRGAEFRQRRAARRTCASRVSATTPSTAAPAAASCTSVVAIAAVERARVAAYAVCGRAAGRRLQAQQGAGVLRWGGQDGSP